MFDLILDGNLLDMAHKNAEVWENDKLEENISNRDIHIIDLCLTITSSMKAMLHFIPQFTSDMEEAMKTPLELFGKYVYSTQITQILRKKTDSFLTNKYKICSFL
jgi:hypothetical protein